ncbi:MAG TPA: phosphonate metabolism protein/1,5-bisphosphokinase (PRPP-forming) PhnN [Stellaceae bacterium]|nr:phosphonate metabolism protein/1,5-bisphosphokinase (PRPP-forming) PhnN [Stellaceae bacterium]
MSGSADPVRPERRGTLILVVGPSGSGKDTLIEGAREALAGDPRFVFPRRVITRAAEAGGEEHEATTPAKFAASEAAGAFALSWDAHGLRYGIAAGIDAELSQGRHVVVNASRSILAEARTRYRPLAIVEVTAPIEVLAQRLAARGREDAADIAARLARSGAVAVTGVNVIRIETTGTVEESLRKFLAALAAIVG